MSISKGYIPLWRSIFETEEWRKTRRYSEFEAWLDMIASAAYADRVVAVDMRTTVTLSRGELYASQRALAKRWGWSPATVNRYISRLAGGASPRIIVDKRKATNETANQTANQTANETLVTIIKLVNYERYNSVVSVTYETQEKTTYETRDETINNKSIRIKGENYTTLNYLELKDKFVRACMRNTHDAHVEAGRLAKMMAEVSEADAIAKHNEACRRDPVFNVVFWLWWKYSDLQLSFEKPLHPQQVRELLAMMTIDELGDIIESIYNERDRVRGRSLYHTVKHWKVCREKRKNRRR